MQPNPYVQRKLAASCCVIGAAFLHPRVGATTAATAAAHSYGGIGFAMTACLMAYNGWSYVSFIAGGEVKDPSRNLPLALALGMLIVMALYVGANLGYMNVMTLPEIASAERVGAAVAERTHRVP